MSIRVKITGSIKASLLKKMALIVWLLINHGLFMLAQDFVYQPMNPAFGGNYFNYQWLLASAQVQNSYENKKSDTALRDPLLEFKDNLNRNILGQLSRNLMRNYFGEGITQGQYNVGSYEIEIAPGPDGLNIVILDTTTGDKTTVTVPYY